MPLPIGTKLGRYTLEELLGRGGMAEVYAATDDVSGASVAIKVLHATGPEVTARLLREARAQGRVSHPNVLPVLDLIDAAGAPALVMPLVRGPSLRERLAEGLGAEAREAIALGLLSGLAAAHAAGLVHRDVKPANVLLGEGPEGLTALLADFGLVGALEGDGEALTRTGAGLGTPGYMAPEQLADAKRADARADVFSAGVTLYQLFTGRRPFPQREPGAFLAAVRAGDFRPLGDATSKERAALIARCLSAAPGDRPADAAALLAEWGGEAPPETRRDDGEGPGGLDVEGALSSLTAGSSWTERRAVLALVEVDEVAGEVLRERLPALRGVEVPGAGGRLCLMRSEEDAAALSAALAAAGRAPSGGLAAGPVQLSEASAAQVGRGAARLSAGGPVVALAEQLAALAPAGAVLTVGELAVGELAVGELSAGELPGAAALGWWRLKGRDEPLALWRLGAAEELADGEGGWQVRAERGQWIPVRPPPHNLPPEPDAFFGREGALAALSAALEAPGVVTLLGGGGVGKTRLGRRLAWRQLGAFPGGVWFCDLSDARSLEGLLGGVARALGIPLTVGDPLDQLGYALYARGRCLVVLDNLEQIPDAAREALARWRQRAPEARFLATSRARLEAAGERVFPVEPLAAVEEGVPLFEDRYRKVRPGFVLDSESRPRVEAIVRSLEGLPLAIELAAARGLSLEALSDQLRDRLSALSVLGDEERRRSTLRGTIDWSWGLLEGWEQSALAQLSAFAGGFSLESAEAALALEDFEDPPWPEDVIQALVDKSLLRTWEVSGLGERADIEEPWFGMFVSIREYAADKLRAPGAFPGSGPDAERAAWERHGEHFAALGDDEALDALEGPGGWAAQLRLRQERDNLVAAAERAIARGAPSVAARAAAAAAVVFEQLGPLDAGLALARAARQLPGLGPAEAARLLLAESGLLVTMGRMRECSPLVEEARALAVEAARPDLALRARYAAATLLGRQGDFAGANEALASVRLEAAAMGLHAVERMACNGLGIGCMQLGQLETAEAVLQEGLALNAAHGHRLTASRLLISLGFLYADALNKVNEAEPYILQAMESLREADATVQLAMCFEHLARVRRYQGRLDDAMAELERGLALARAMGSRDAAATALGNMSHIYFDKGEPAGAVAVLEEALRLHEEIGSQNFVAIFRGLRALGLLELGRLEEMIVEMEASIALVTGLGLRTPMIEFRVYLAEALGERGDVARELEVVRACRGEWAALGKERQYGLTCLRLSALEDTFGDPASGAALFAEAKEELLATGEPRMACYASDAELGRLERAGRREEALALALALQERAGALKVHNLARKAGGAAARLLAEQGRLAEARATLDALELAADSQLLLNRTGAEVDAAVVASLEGRAAAARAGFARATGGLREAGMVKTLALVLLEQVAAERRLGGDWRAPLAEARALSAGLVLSEASWLGRRLAAEPL
jgi:predicted ATPase